MKNYQKKRVTEILSNKCPYCHKVMTMTEGSSSKNENLVTIQCAYCSKEYYYVEEDNILNALGEVRVLSQEEKEELTGMEYPPEVGVLYFPAFGCYVLRQDNKYVVPICNEEFYADTFTEAIKILIEEWVITECM